MVLLRALLRKKWIIMGVSIFATGLAFFLTLNYKETYKSSAQLATGFTIAEQVSVVNEKFNLFEADVKFNNLIETINSPKVFSMLSYRLLLHDLDGIEVPFRMVQNKEKYDEVMLGTSVEEVVAYVRQKLDSVEILSLYDERDVQLKNLLKLYKYNNSALKDVINVSRVRGTDYLTIEAYTEVSELSAFMVNTLINVFLDYNRSLRSQRSTESAETFANLVEQKRREMEQKSEELKSFKSSNRVLNFEMESSSIIQQISELENKRNEERRKVQGLQYEIADLSDRIKNVSEVSTTNLNPALNSEILTLREQISSVNGRFIATGSSNMVLLDSLKDLRTLLQQKLIQAGSGSTSNTEMDDLVKKRQEKEVEHEIARQNLISIESNLRLLRGSAGGYASKEATIAALERELRMATDEYQSAQEKYSKALDVALASGSNVRPVLEAQPADQPQPSKRLIITALSGISSFVLCVVVIVFLEYIDLSVKSPANFKRLTGIKQMGILLSANVRQKDLMKFLKTNPPPKKLVQYNEILRKLRYEIEANEKKIFLVTSTQPQQGKTTLVLSLAAALSNIKRRVLVIDTNFAHNDLSHRFQAKPTLESIPDAGADISKYITKGSEGVHVIGCKGGAYSPSEILSPGNFLNCLSTLLNNYDYIFLEGAALNNYSDSKELEKYVQGVIGVFSAKSVIRQIDRDSITYLTNLGDKFVGAVLNNVEIHNLDQ